MLGPSPQSPNYLFPPLSQPLPPPLESPPPSATPTNPNHNQFPPSLISKRPSLRVTSEFDSDSCVFFHKVSCKLFDNLATLKLSFINNNKREISEPQLALTSKYLAIHYDPEEQNALIKSSFDVGPMLHFRAAHDLKDADFLRKCNFSSYATKENFENRVLFLVLVFEHLRHNKVAMIANLSNPSYAVEVSSPVPYVRLRKVTIRFPMGEVALEEREEEEVPRILLINGILKGPIFNGVCAAHYIDEELKLRYLFKDGAISFIPSISLPSNALSFAFRRRFSPSDKLSYWYNLDSNYWSAVYKHTYDKDLKFKAGYDLEVCLGWASLWVGDENVKAKTASMKMKVQFMHQVPQDDIKSSALMFRVEKRWDVL